jgi:predicted HD superfamily hydrolase involved in NAD metabolism
VHIDIKNWLKQSLDDERYKHLLGSELIARELAVRFKVDPERASLAALVHDCAKNISYDELIRIIQENNINVSEMEIKSKKPLHAPVSSFIARKNFGIVDEEILNAIRYHTIGRVNMTMLEKIVFLADKIEPNTRDKLFSKKILDILNTTNNIDDALFVCYAVTIESLIKRRMLIDPETINVWNSLIDK